MDTGSVTSITPSQSVVKVGGVEAVWIDSEERWVFQVDDDENGPAYVDPDEEDVCADCVDENADETLTSGCCEWCENHMCPKHFLRHKSCCFPIGPKVETDSEDEEYHDEEDGENVAIESDEDDLLDFFYQEDETDCAKEMKYWVMNMRNECWSSEEEKMIDGRKLCEAM